MQTLKPIGGTAIEDALNKAMASATPRCRIDPSAGNGHPAATARTSSSS